MRRLVEIRTYRLLPGTGAAFHHLVTTKSLPLLADFGMEVVTARPSLDDPDGYVLIRAYDDPDHCQSTQAAFYGSAPWRTGPRAAILALIQSCASVTLWLPQATVISLKNALTASC